MSQPTKRQLQAQKTRQHIIDCVFQLMQDHSLDQLKVTDICSSAQVSVGTFYHYFPSKEHVVLGIFGSIDDYLSREVFPVCMTMEPLAAIVFYMKQHIGYCVAHGVDSGKNLIRVQLESGKEIYSDMAREVQIYLHQLLLRAKEAGALPPEADLDRIRHDLLTFSRGINYCWCIEEGTIDAAATLERTVTLYLKGLGASFA